MSELYQVKETGRGDFAVTAGPLCIQTGLTKGGADQFASSLNYDIGRVSLDELQAAETLFDRVAI